jgi:CTP synthase (UTP-ammonia lyase)
VAWAGAHLIEVDEARAATGAQALARPRARLLILGEFDPTFTPHAATNEAIRHSSAHLGIDIQPHWMSTADVTPYTFFDCDGLWIAPGSPYKSMERTLDAIRHARENGVPCLGTCGGCQHMIIEYARNFLGIRDAQHAEYDPYASNLFISSLTCSLAGRAMQLDFAAGSRVARMYGATTATEEYYCNFGVNPDVIPVLRNGALKVVGSDAEGDVRVLELPTHPFFVATLFVPQARSRPDAPHPLVNAFLQVIMVRHAERKLPRRPYG